MADDSQLAEATQALSFAEFLERMKDPQAANLVKLIKTFIKTFDDKPPNPDKDAERVQVFLTKSEGTFRDHPVWGLEKYLMTKIYYKTFAQSDLDRERDEALSQRMAALSFVRPEHLDIPKQYHEEGSWLRAINELHKLNSYKAPRDKLVCVLNCCRVINNLLHVADNDGNEARGADDFLPVLIYVVIHANPPQLASNLEYIQRFRMHSRMVSESAYFFTQLYSAASFIETINSSSLTMDSDEFVARMIAAGIPDIEVASTQPMSPKQAPTVKAPQAGVGLIPLGPEESLGLTPQPSQASLASSPERAKGTATASASDTTVNPMLRGNTHPEPPAPTPQPPTAASDAHTSSAPLVDSPSASQTAPASLIEDPLTPLTPSQTPIDNQAANAPQAAASQQHPWPSVAQLEAEGMEQMLQAEAAGNLQQRYSFLYASAPDMRVDDVPVLLRQYKELILKHEALVCAVESHRAQQGKLQPEVGQVGTLLTSAPSGGKSSQTGQGGAQWQHYGSQTEGPGRSSLGNSREALPEASFSEPSAQHASSSSPAQHASSSSPAQHASSTPPAQHDNDAAAAFARAPEASPFGSASEASAQPYTGISQSQALQSPHRSQSQTATVPFASSGVSASPVVQQNEAQVKNTLTAASQPLPPEATAEVDAKVVDDRFVTMSSANALEEAVQSENHVAASADGRGSAQSASQANQSPSAGGSDMFSGLEVK